MNKIERRTNYIDGSLGFPVEIDCIKVIVKPYGEIPLVDSSAYQRAAAIALAEKSTRLTGNEVRYLRLHAELTYQALARILGVTHPAVKKWEASRGEVTNMAWATEVVLRLYVLTNQEVSRDRVMALVTRLQKGILSEPHPKVPLFIRGNTLNLFEEWTLVGRGCLKERVGTVTLTRGKCATTGSNWSASTKGSLSIYERPKSDNGADAA